jgi:hypothetical protein
LSGHESNMSYDVTIDSVNESQWTQSARLFADYSIYQTCAYQQVRGQIDGSDVHRLIVRADDGEILAMCHVRVQRVRPLGLRIGYVQWGPLLRKGVGAIGRPADLLNVLRDACFGLGIDVLRLAPNWVDDAAGKEISAALKEIGFRKLEDVPAYHTTLLSLNCDVAALRQGLHQSWRRMLHKAEAAGVDVKEHTDQGPFGMLQRFYADLARKKGLKGVDPNVFARTQIALPESEKMCLTVGYRRDEPVTVHVTSNLGATGVFLLSASSQDGYECRASYLAWWRAITRSSDVGMKNYDTGGIDFTKAPDIARFKAGIGGNETFHIGTFEAYVDKRASIIWSVSKRLYRLVRW